MTRIIIVKNKLHGVQLCTASWQADQGSIDATLPSCTSRLTLAHQMLQNKLTTPNTLTMAFRVRPDINTPVVANTVMQDLIQYLFKF